MKMVVRGWQFTAINTEHGIRPRNFAAMGAQVKLVMSITAFLNIEGIVGRVPTIQNTPMMLKCFYDNKPRAI